jgi:Na+-transporting NADH:ubiquinone oxidoreductase subunit NqrF
MEKKLDLNDLQIEAVTAEETDTLVEHSDGHGLTEVGASCNGNNSCGQGSCKTK